MEQKEIEAIWTIGFLVVFTLIWFLKPEWFEHLKDD